MKKSDAAGDKALLTRRRFALGLAFMSTAGVAAFRQPNVNLDYFGENKLVDVLPKQIGRWRFVTNSGLVIPPEDQLSRALYSQLLTRVYSANDQSSPVMLLVAQSSSQTGILQIHRPESCYTAGGYSLSAVEPHVVELPSGPLETLSLQATNDIRTEQILYWTRIGEHLPANWRQQRMAVARDNLRRIIPDALMVRVSVINNDRAAAFATMDAFIQAMIESIRPQLRQAFIA